GVKKRGTGADLRAGSVLKPASGPDGLSAKAHLYPRASKINIQGPAFAFQRPSDLPHQPK
ncbi:MAG TPA: hypothetical protein VJX73_05555, partial [Terracidiphilus sp.]|nr:hypothetical protein [Terracidiphilus sp.]